MTLCSVTEIVELWFLLDARSRPMLKRFRLNYLEKIERGQGRSRAGKAATSASVRAPAMRTLHGMDEGEPPTTSRV